MEVFPSAWTIRRSRSRKKASTALADVVGDKIIRDVFLAFVRVHVLHHAATEPIFGVEMMDELRRHGYDISPGTLYPVLHALEKGGVLVSAQEVVEGKVRKYYRTTKTGDALLLELRERIGELVEEVLGQHLPHKPSKPKVR